MAKTELLLLFLLLLSIQAQSRSISETFSDPVSDGVSHFHQPSSSLLLRLPSSSSSSSSSGSSSCYQTYNFIPCTTTILGNIFFMLVYGYFMFHAAKYVSTSTELFLQISGPGLGGISLSSVSEFPQAILILVSGLSGSIETAQQKVLVGMGLLCGSTVFRLTLVWGSCIVAGKCDFAEDKTSTDFQDTKRCSLTGSGITTDMLTRSAARVMSLSAIPYVIVLLASVFKTSSGHRIAVFFSLIASMIFLICFFIYQYFQPSIQRRRLAYVKHKFIMSGILRYVQSSRFGRLLTEDGQPDDEAIKKLFLRLDADRDELLTIEELKSVLIGFHFDETDLDRDDAATNVMEDFDISGDAKINMEEFSAGVKKWLEKAKGSVPQQRSYSKKSADAFYKKIRRQYERIDPTDEDVEGVENPTKVKLKAMWMLCMGTLISLVFSSPLVDAVTNFSNATSIPSFFISFVAIPLATNSKEAVSEITLARRKKTRTISLTLSQIYSEITNNIICLAVFLALVYARNLTWEFSAEVVVIFFVCIVMGLFTSFRMTFPLWTCFVAFLLYPLSLALIYVLGYVVGWS